MRAEQKVVCQQSTIMPKMLQYDESYLSSSCWAHNENAIFTHLWLEKDVGDGRGKSGFSVLLQYIFHSTEVKCTLVY